MFVEDLEIQKKLKSLSEKKLRKLIRAFFAEKISHGNVQPMHGVGEHGKDAVAVIDEIEDPLGKKLILLIQVKKGDVSLTVWTNRISGQILSALNTLESQFPRGTSRDNPRRLLLFLSGELMPEAYEAVGEWNRSQHIPVEVFDIHGICKLLRKYGVKESDFEDLLKLADTLNL